MYQCVSKGETECLEISVMCVWGVETVTNTMCVCVCVCSEERQRACTNYNCVLRGETECLHKLCGQNLVRFSKK